MVREPEGSDYAEPTQVRCDADRRQDSSGIKKSHHRDVGRKTTNRDVGRKSHNRDIGFEIADRDAGRKFKPRTEFPKGGGMMDIPRNWTFENTSIAENFDRHVKEQLPFYQLATGAVAHIARHYVPRGGLVYDIGASTGNIGRALASILEDREAELVPIEASTDMALLYTGPGAESLICGDAMEVDYDAFDVAVIFLTLMFMPVAERGGWLAKLCAKMRPGGAIILFDKCVATRGYAATVLWRLTLAGKMAAGVEPSEIIAKELSLGGVQRPLCRKELPACAVEWMRFGEFAGWLIEKKP
jgi:tRNA (cmo5U34)-methyltransferase